MFNNIMDYRLYHNSLNENDQKNLAWICMGNTGNPVKYIFLDCNSKYKWQGLGTLIIYILYIYD